MKVKIMQENFAKALNYVSKAVSSTPSIPVLANVLLEIKKGKLHLSTTNLEVSITTAIGADVKGDGKITVDAKTLTEFVNSLSSGTLTLNLKENIFTVKNEKNSADFKTINADEFPPLPQPTKTPIMEIDAEKFSKAVNQVAVSCAGDDSRPVLTGILFESNESILSLVGVDGFRLSKKIIKLEQELKKDLKQIVPSKALTELARIVNDVAEEEEPIKIFLLNDKNQMLFQIDDLSLSTRLIEGEYPDYKQIIPTESKVKFSVDKESLSQTVKIASIFARGAVGNKAVFEFMPEENMLKFSAQVADVGENESTVEVFDLQGDKLKTAFNTRFLSDMINIIKGDEIHFESNGVTAPGVFKDKEDKDFLHIIMPMRID